MRHGSLFSGIGGFDLAAEWMAWENIFHCEIEEFPRKVLNYYWPKAISYEDIKQTDFSIHRGQIDIITGGFPCQPYSVAGKRKGKEDDRHLWPEMLRAIREIKPTWIVGENVRGLIGWDGGLVFDEVQTDLEAIGYEVQPFLLPACAVNAPHRRDRIWFIAYAGKKSGKSNTIGRRQEYRQKREQVRSDITSISQIGVTPNSKIEQSERLQSEQREISEQEQRELGRSDSKNDATNSNINKRCKGRMHKEGQETTERYFSSCNTWETWRTWENFPTVSPIHDRDDGLSDRLVGITFPKWRNEAIKGCGNAIVPQVALQIFKAIEEYESLELNDKS